MAKITLVTGLPGSGKSLWTIAEVMREFPVASGRQVYVDGIRDLRVPAWVELGGVAGDVRRWYELETGAVVVVDEAQRVWRPRNAAAAVPMHVEKLETHRHQGIDLFLITQHPRLIDPAVRALANRHIHMTRKFGMEAATVWEWPRVQENPERAGRDAMQSVFVYPREVYKLYKSAEVHTVKRRLPWKLLAPLVAVVAAVGYFIHAGYGAVKEVMQPAVPSVVQEKVGPVRKVSGEGPASRRVSSRDEWLSQREPRVAEFAHTAPIYDAVLRPRVAPVPAMCVVLGSECRCYSQQATRLASVPDGTCRELVRDGWFDVTREPERIRPGRARAAEGASASEAPAVPRAVEPGELPSVTVSAPVPRPEHAPPGVRVVGPAVARAAAPAGAPPRVAPAAPVIASER